MINLTFLKIGICFALFAVILGAFGAHGLKSQLSEAQINTFEVGVRYQFYHAFALILLAILFAFLQEQSLLKYAGYLFTTGILFFSGSIYLLACRELLGIESWTWLGPITPLGGLCFIIAWVLLLLATFKQG